MKTSKRHINDTWIVIVHLRLENVARLESHERLREAIPEQKSGQPQIANGNLQFMREHADECKK